MTFTKFKYEIIGIIIVLIIYWYFNIREANVLTISVPLEKMSNISIFDGNNI